MSQIRTKTDFIRPRYYKSASLTGRRLLQGLIPTTWLDLECSEVISRTGDDFELGNAIKYLWRCGNKDDWRDDLTKASYYLTRYQSRLQRPWAKVRQLLSPKPWRDRQKVLGLIWDIRREIE